MSIKKRRRARVGPHWVKVCSLFLLLFLLSSENEAHVWERKVGKGLMVSEYLLGIGKPKTNIE